MKKITLIVPDEIDNIIGTSATTKIYKRETTAETIKSALCDRSEYHVYYQFDWDDVVIISIKDC